MFLLETWQRITVSRRTREREAAAQYERVQREGALRDDFARRTQALESQLAQAHAENCRLRAESHALLNSVLGIAGLPPVIVADPSLNAGESVSDARPETPFVHAQHGSAALTASGLPAADTCLDAAHSAASQIPESRHPEERSDKGSLFVPPDCPDAKSKRGPSGKSGPQDDGVIRGGASENGAASPSTCAERSSATPLPGQTPLASTTLDSNAAPPQKQLRNVRGANRTRAVSDPHAIAPVRRRSWHQIYRMLEFESSRRKDHEP